MFHHHAPNSSSAIEQHVAGVALTAPNMPIGANLAPLVYFDATPVFTDLMYQGFGLMVQGTSTPVAVDATDGWPVSDFEAVTQTLPALAAQTDVVFEIKGQASSYVIRLPQTGDTILSVGAWDSGTNTQLVTVRMTSGRPADVIRLQLNNTKRTGSSAAGTGVQGVIACRPGYALATVKTQRFTTEYLAFVAPVACLRFMDWQAINGTQNFGQGADFTKRPTRTLRRTTMSYSEDGGTTTKTTAKAIGCCLEDIIDLMEAAGKDGWVHHPYYATSAYVSAQYTLLHAGLTKGQKVNGERCNEVWNTSANFDQQARNVDDTATELNGYADVSSSGGKTRYLASATRSANVVTLNLSLAPVTPYVANGANRVTLANIDGDGNNTSYIVQSVPSSTSITVNKAGANGAVSAGSGFSLVDERTTSNLVSAGVLNVFTAAAYRMVRMARDDSETIRGVVGNANILTRYRPVFAWQAINDDFFKYLAWLDANYGIAVGGRGVSGYLYAIAGAPYYFLDGTPVSMADLRSDASSSLTVVDYVSTFAATAKVSKKAYVFEGKTVAALHFGIQHFCYEGGPDSVSGLANGSANNIKMSQAQLDAGMKQPYKDLVSDFARYGTNEPLYCMYAHSVGDPNSALAVDRFWSTDSVTNLAAPKVAAMSELAAAVIPTPTRNVGAGTFDGRLYAGHYTDLDANLLSTGLYPWWTGNDQSLRGTLDRVWSEPAATPQTRTITITYTCNFASWQCHVDINGVRIAASQALSASPADLTTTKTIGPFTFTSKPGQNAIELVKAAGGTGRDGQIRSITIA